MNTNAKKILLTGTAFLAVSLAGIGAAHAAVQDLNAGGLTVTAGNVDGSNFSANVTSNVANGSAAITGPITNTTTGHGTLNFLGGAVSVNGTVGVGGGGPISAITLGVAGSSTTFGAAVNAGSVTYNDVGTATFNGTTTITGSIALNGGSLIVGNGNAVSANIVSGGGTVTFTNGGALATSNGGSITSMVNTAGNSTYNGTATIGAVSVNGGSLTIGFPAASISGAAALGANTLSFGGSSIASVTGSGGTLNLTGSSTQTISGTVGGVGSELNTLALTGTGTKTFGSAVRAVNVTTNASTVTGAGVLTVGSVTNTAGATTIANNVNTVTVNVQAGSLALNGTNTVTTVNMGAAAGNPTTALTGTIGNVTNLNHLGGTSTVASATATNTGVSGGGHMTLTSGNLGAVTFGAGGGQVTGAGITSIAGNAAFTGTGTVDSQVTGIGVTTANGGTGTIVVSNAASTLSGASLAANTGLTFTGTAINGAVAGTGAGATLTLDGAGNQAVTGAIGSGTALGTVNLNGGGTKTLAAITATTTNIATGVTANTDTITGAVNFTGNGTLNIADTHTITGAVTTASNGTGTLNLLGGAKTLAGAIGTGANRLATVTTANTTGTTVFTGGVNANTLTIANGGSVTVNGNSNITNAITLGTGLLTIGNGATFTAEGGIGVGAGNNVTLAGGTFATNVASSIDTLNTSGTSVVGGTAATTIGTLNVNGGTFSMTNAGSTVTGATGLGANTLDFAGTSLGAVTGAGGTLNLTSGNTTVGAIGTNGNNLATVSVGTGTKTFGTDLYANTLSFTGAGTADLTATTTAAAQAVNFGNNNGTVTFGAALAFSGAVSALAGNGNVTFGDGVTVTGTIGSAGNKINTLTFAGGTNTISTPVYATMMIVGAGGLTTTNTTLDTNVNFAADSVLNVANNTNITGHVTTATAGTGTIAYAGGGLTIGGNLARIKALTLNSNATIGGTAIAADTTNIGIHKLTVNGTSFETAGASTQLNFSVFNNVGGSGQIVANGVGTTVNVVTGTKVNVSVDTADVIVQGQEYVLIDGHEAAASTIGTTTLTTTNTALLHFKQKLVADGVSDGTKNLIVYADRTQISTVTVDPNNGAVGKMLDALGAGGDADVDALQVRLANFGVGQGAAVENMISTVTPDASGAAQTATTGVGAAASAIISSQFSQLAHPIAVSGGTNVEAGPSVGRGTKTGTGASTGNGVEGVNFWGQAFGATADQSRRSSFAGYDSESFGAIFGADAEVIENLRAGLAFVYADTDVSGQDSNRTSTEIDSYQLSLYAAMDLGNDYYVGGQAAYMYNDISTARHNVGGLAGNTARADYHSDQYSVRAEAGRHLSLDNGFFLTPSANAHYSYIDTSDYSEKGAGGLSLRNVKSDEVQILEFGVNLMAAVNLDDNHGGVVTPNVHGGYRYDVIGDAVATSAALAGGGTAFRTQGFDPAQGTGNIGTGVTWSTQSGLDLSANYDYETKSDYKAHSGYVRAGYKF